MKGKETMGKSTCYVVTSTSGTVRDSSARILGEVRAGDPVAAIKPYLTGIRKGWVIHGDSRSKLYARAENPMSFVSDMIDNVSARAGAIVRDDKSRIYYKVELIEWSLSLKAKVIVSKDEWAAKPLDAVRQCLREEDVHMPLIADDTGDYFINVPVAGRNRRGQSYRATAIAEYIPEKAD